MEDKSKRRAGPPGASVTGALALLLVICLVECATGSCLSYGHSCWGAHGKRSGKSPAAATDWFLAKLFRHVDIADLNRARQSGKIEEPNAIYRGEAPDDSTADQLSMDSGDIPLEIAANRNPEAKPMLDDDLLSKIKLWQIMREVSEEK